MAFQFQQGIKAQMCHLHTKNIKYNCSVVLYRRENTISNQIPHSVRQATLRYHYDFTLWLERAVQQLVNRWIFHMEKLNQPPPPAGTRNPKHNFL